MPKVDDEDRWSDSGELLYPFGSTWESPPLFEWPQEDNQPVVCVSWNDAVAFTKWISSKSGMQFRLPTGAEWEYAARAGTQTIYYWGDELGYKKAYCSGCVGMNPFKRTATVGSNAPNAFGLYDMIGNVWEWTCSEHTKFSNDRKKYKYDGRENKCSKSASQYSSRGGAWNTLDGDDARVDTAYSQVLRPHNADYRDNYIGFRIVREK